jgi:ketol-acid reductoisomerase
LRRQQQQIGVIGWGSQGGLAAEQQQAQAQNLRCSPHSLEEGAICC